MYLSSQYSISVSESQEETVGLLTSQQRQSIFKPNDVPTYGLYNRNDFMQRCYKRCRKLNDKAGPQLKRLLCFGGESSKKGDCCSTLFFMMAFVLPLMSLAILVPNRALDQLHKIIVVSACLTFLLLLSFWHAYSIYVITYNIQKWRECWFTIEVISSMIPQPAQPIGSGGRGDRFFDIRSNMRYYDVTKQDLANSPVLGIGDKKALVKKFEELNISRARLILYTKRFINAVSAVPKNFAVILFVVTLICVAISTVELLFIAGVF